ncbi:cytochrome P450 4C1-like isoform X1 [Tenebrio molitor]|uniref:cytochrome P450 4C1-like isoform X1 n=1 Tax=Tenebrio molitor TaxID=7067 RepID=UPI003624812D
MLNIILFIFVLIFLAKYYWNRRRLYYHAWKIEGPFAWPIIGSAYLFIRRHEDVYNTATKLINSQPPIFKLWMGAKLVILTTQPTHAEVILKTCFNRLGTKQLQELIHVDLFTAPVDIWRTHRKIINKSFNTKILNSYVDIFDKRARHLMRQFEEKCDGNYIDVLEALLRCSLDTACEALLDVDPNSITGQARYIANTNRMTKISVIRGSSIWLQSNFIWRYSSLDQEVTNLRREAMDFIRQIIEKKKLDTGFYKNCSEDNFGKDKLLINNLINSIEAGELDESGVLDEIHSILAAGETAAITNALLLCMMGLHSNIQKNIQEELDSIFGHSDRIVTLEDVNRMYYLERVVKETMRLFPPAPFLRRSVDEDIKLDSHVLPKGSEVFIPLVSLHRRRDLWNYPLVFDPDRFLAENEASRPDYSYLPFGNGRRNCIGFKYATLSMKTMLAIFFKHYEVQSTEYKSVEDVEFWLNIVAYPKRGCKVKLQKLEKKNS